MTILGTSLKLRLMRIHDHINPPFPIHGTETRMNRWQGRVKQGGYVVSVSYQMLRQDPSVIKTFLVEDDDAQLLGKIVAEDSKTLSTHHLRKRNETQEDKKE